MSREIFSGKAHESIRANYEGYHRDVVGQVERAVQDRDFVIVGMAQNPFCKRACKAAEATGRPFEYLEYGSYFSSWKPRLAIKMWSGWPTFPQVFIKGELIGGAQDLERLIASGELDTLLS